MARLEQTSLFGKQCGTSLIYKHLRNRPLIDAKESSHLMMEHPLLLLQKTNCSHSKGHRWRGFTVRVLFSIGSQKEITSWVLFNHMKSVGPRNRCFTFHPFNFFGLAYFAGMCAVDAIEGSGGILIPASPTSCANKALK